MTFDVLVAVLATVAAAVASVAGFGIGSILTPFLSLRFGTKLAVAAVAIPHFVATAIRFWMLRRFVNRRVLWSFGIMSAAGGLAGAALHSQVTSRVLSVVLGALLMFAGIMGLTGLSSRMRFGRRMAWVSGGVSGFFGGLVGNQGGIRSAALLGFDVPRDAFVATATAIGLFVDVARMPVYLVSQGRSLAQAWTVIAIATVGTILGTVMGARILRRIPESVFRRAVSILILVLGIFMLIRA